MKVAFLVGKFPNLSETFILNQVVGLVKHGHQVDIYGIHPKSTNKVHPDVIKYRIMEKIHYYPDFPKNYYLRFLKGILLVFLNFIEAPFSIIRSLNIIKYKRQAASLKLLYSIIPFIKSKREYDIIHCHFASAGLLGASIKEVLGLNAKLVTTFYGYDVNAYPKIHGKNVYFPLFDRGDGYIAISTFIAEEAIALGCPRDLVTKIPLGITPSDYPFKPREIATDEPIKITTVARLVEKKGLEYSIKAISELAKTHPNILYRIAGDGYLREELENLIFKLGMSEKVYLLGWKTKDEVRDLYDDSHIFLLSSVTASNGDKEGQGLVLQEAQAMGLPVVATIHNGFPDSVLDGQSAYLVPEREVNKLVEKLTYLIEHPEKWIEMGIIGRKFVEENFSLGKLDEQLLDFYYELIHKSS